MKHKTQTLTGNLRLSLMLFFGLVLFLCAGTVIANADTGGVVPFGNETFTEPKSYEGDTTIVLNGNAEINITPESGGSPATALIVNNGTLTIQGTGSLKVNGVIAADKFVMKSGKVTINSSMSGGMGLVFFEAADISGGELTVYTSTESSSSMGPMGPMGAITYFPYKQSGVSSIDSASLTISNGAKVIASGVTTGIASPSIVIDDAVVSASGNTAGNIPSIGIYAINGMTIKNGSNVKTSGSYTGIMSTGPLVFDNSRVEMTAEGFKVETSSGTSAPDVMALLAYDPSTGKAADVTVKNSKITTPASGKIGPLPVESSDSSSVVPNTILNADGTVAKKVIIEPVVTVTAAESAIMKALGVDAATAKAINAYAAKNGISADTLKITNKLLTTGNTDKDVKGSKFGLLQAYTKKIKKKAVTIKWKKVPGADGYMIYSNKCGKKNKCKLVKTLPAGKTSFTSKKLKKGTYYKYVVVAYKNFNGTKVTISASPTIHAATLGGKYGVAKKVKIVKVGKKKKTKITLKKGKKAKIKAKEIKAKKKIKRHRKLCYESSNTKVATVTKKGVIKAVAKGKCKIYVYAQNGVKKAVTVTVK